MQFKVPVLTEFIAPSSSSPGLEPSSHHLWSLFPPGIGQSGEGSDQCISPSTAIALSLSVLTPLAMAAGLSVSPPNAISAPSFLLRLYGCPQSP